MEKIVKSGLRDCTVTLDGTECSVKFDSCYRAFSVRNDGTADVYISKSSGIVPDADGVMCVKSGGSAVFAHMDIYADTVYLLGTGKVQIHAQNDTNNPFKSAPVQSGGGDADVDKTYELGAAGQLLYTYSGNSHYAVNKYAAADKYWAIGMIVVSGAGYLRPMIVSDTESYAYVTGGGGGSAAAVSFEFDGKTYFVSSANHSGLSGWGGTVENNTIPYDSTWREDFVDVGNEISIKIGTEILERYFKRR